MSMTRQVKRSRQRMLEKVMYTKRCLELAKKYGVTPAEILEKKREFDEKGKIDKVLRSGSSRANQ